MPEMAFAVMTTHTFTVPGMDDRRFATAADAWSAAAVDYMLSDAGLPVHEQLADARRLQDQTEPGTVKLTSGEEITVVVEE